MVISLRMIMRTKGLPDSSIRIRLIWFAYENVYASARLGGEATFDTLTRTVVSRNNNFQYS